jgi:hypothetical protein
MIMAGFYTSRNGGAFWPIRGVASRGIENLTVLCDSSITTSLAKFETRIIWPRFTSRDVDDDMMIRMMMMMMMMMMMLCGRYIENLTVLRRSSTTASLAQSKTRYERFLANQKKLVEALQLITNQGILLCDEVGQFLSHLTGLASLVRFAREGYGLGRALTLMIPSITL